MNSVICQTRVYLCSCLIEIYVSSLLGRKVKSVVRCLQGSLSVAPPTYHMTAVLFTLNYSYGTLK